MSSVKHSQEYIGFLTSLLRNAAFIVVYNELIIGLPALVKERANAEASEALNRMYRAVTSAFEEQISFDEFKLMWMQILVARNVEAFEYYLSQILMRTFLHRPETLKTSEKVTVREVLETRTMDEFTKWAADRKIVDLSFEGLRGIVRYLQQELDVKVNDQTEDFRIAAEFIEVRHIIAHNAGRVSNLFLKRTNRSDLKSGDNFPLTVDYLNQASTSLRNVAEDLDISIVSHFDLPTGKTP